VTGNHLSFDVPSANILPAGATPTMILVKSGSNNYIAANHTIANVGVRAVVLDGSTVDTKVLDCGTAAEFQALAGATHGFRATP
jgi:inulin fructotransferase (DFA-I-forming)